MSEYKIIFLANIPSFYRDNLFNEISKKINILVIYMANKDSSNRTEDFYSKDKNFDFVFLHEGEYDNRPKIKSLVKLFQLFSKLKYEKLCLTQWNSVESWFLMLVSPKKRNCLVMESSEFESKLTGIKKIIKQIFLKKITFGLPSGKYQENLLRRLGFKGECFKTKGVGIFNKEDIKRTANSKKENVKNFIFVGRLSSEKNIDQLIRVFKDKIDLNLTVVGQGKLEKKLKKQATSNIKFLGYINNKELKEIYLNNDVLILPSLREPWGLVVEEALYFGLPVILSNRVGSNELIEDGKHGYIYNVNSDKELKEKINLITKSKIYNKMKKNVINIDFEKRDKDQVNTYLKILD